MFSWAFLLWAAEAPVPAPAPKVYRYTVAERARILLVQPPPGVTYHIREWAPVTTKPKDKRSSEPRVELLRKREFI